MSNKNSTHSGAIGLNGLVFCIFLTLKLMAVEPVASWSWWWVTSPLWMVAALVVAIMGCVIGWEIFADRRRNKRGW